MAGLAASLAVSTTPITDAAQDVLDAIATLGSQKRIKAGAALLTYPAHPSVPQSVQSSASANAFGAYVEMVAATAAEIVIVGIAYRRNVGSVNAVTVRIGQGAPASEVTRADIWLHATNSNDGVVIPIPWTVVAAGARVAVQVSDDQASANTGTVALLYVPTADLEAF